MNLAALALWLLTLIVLGCIVWFIFRKMSVPSLLVKAAGLLAGIMFVLIIVGLVIGVLPLSIQPSPSPSASKPDTLSTTLTANRMFLPLVSKSPAVLSLPVAAPTGGGEQGLVAVAPASGQQVYIVQPGDTLFSIARKFGLTVQQIQAANNIANPNAIRAGQTLIIPVVPQPARTPAPALTPGAGQILYKVQDGDTLYKIAEKYYGDPNKVQPIIAANYGIDTKTPLEPGRTLIIPRP